MVFLLPEDEEQKTIWFKFMNRMDSIELKNIFICYKHFGEDVTAKSPTCIKLKSILKPAQTIVPDSQKVDNLISAAILETHKTARKSPKPWVLRKDEFDDFKNKKKCISNYEVVLSKGPKNVDKDYILHHKNECILLYKLESNLEQAPKLRFVFV